MVVCNLIALKKPQPQNLSIVALKPAFTGGIMVAFFFGFWVKLSVFETSGEDSDEHESAKS